MKNKQNFFLVLLQGVNIARLVIVNIIFFVLLFVVLAALAGLSEPKEMAKKLYYGTILDISPKGIIEEKEGEYGWKLFFLKDEKLLFLKTSQTQFMRQQAMKK